MAGERGGGSRDETRSDLQEVALSLLAPPSPTSSGQVSPAGTWEQRDVTCGDSLPGRPRPLPLPPLTSGFVDVHHRCVSVQVHQVEVFERV